MTRSFILSSYLALGVVVGWWWGGGGGVQMCIPSTYLHRCMYIHVRVGGYYALCNNPLLGVTVHDNYNYYQDPVDMLSVFGTVAFSHINAYLLPVAIHLIMALPFPEVFQMTIDQWLGDSTWVT